MQKKFFITVLVLLFFFSNSAFAHHFYVSVTESMAHAPGSIVTNIGWGHGLPFDDFCPGDMLSSYSVYDPDLKKMDFPFDANANKGAEGNMGKEVPHFPGGTMLPGDMYVRKLFFKKNAPQGTYQVAAKMKKTQFSLWIDQKGRQKWGHTYLNDIKEFKKILLCLNFQSFAKSFVTVGKWAEPKPLGHDLELIPLTDLSQVKVGDEVVFKVLLPGKPVQQNMEGLPDLKVFGEHYGADGSHCLRGAIFNGIAKIRVTAPGRWLAVVDIRKPVNKENGPKELIGKALTTGYNASATFFVRP